MAKIQIGTVSEIWRYPVKSLRGQRLEEVALTPDGVLGDRLYAIRELKYGAIMSAKMWPPMLGLRAFWDGQPEAGGVVRIELPDGTSISSDSPQASADALSKLFGHQVRLERTRTGSLSASDIEAIRRGEAFLPQWKFFDEGPIHLLATGTLRHLRRLEDEKPDFDRRRFRPNIMIDTGSDDGGFIEDRWLGGTLEIGDSVRIAEMWPAIRCVMTANPQDELEYDPRILRAAAEHHRAYVGVFACVAQPGIIRTGDSVMLAIG